MRIPHNDRLSSDRSAHEPERKCILSGEHDARDALIRLAVSPPGPDGTCQVLPDVHGRAPGRGAWIGVDRQGLVNAMTKGKLRAALMRAFGKSLDGKSLTVPDDLADRIESAVRRAFLERLGLELRAGRLLLGTDRIAEQARAGRVAWLAHASDASVDGSRKLDQAWRVGQDEEGSGLRGATLPLDRAALSVALGRDNVVHLALADRAAAERLGPAMQRLLRFTDRSLADDAIANEAGAGSAAVRDAESHAVTND